jgi:hypothetical protein
LRGETKKGEEVEAESLPINISFHPRKTRTKVAATATPRSDEHKEDIATAEPQVPVTSLIVVTLSSLAAAGVLVALTKRPKGKSSAARQKYVPQKQLIDALAALEERVSTNTVDLTNPIFEAIENERNETSGEVQGSGNSGAEQVAQPSESGEVEPPKDV